MTPLEDSEHLTESQRTAVEELVETSLESPEDLEQLDINTIFEVLAHPGRRYVLTYLLRSEGFASMSELVDYVIEETGHSMTERQFRYRVAAALTNTHLPKLAEEGFIQYNIERQIVLPTDRTALLEPYVTIALAQQRQFQASRHE